MGAGTGIGNSNESAYFDPVGAANRFGRLGTFFDDTSRIAQHA